MSWTDHAGNEDGFRIERCSGFGCTGFVEVGTAPANATSYQSTGLAAATSYSYRVQAFNAAGQSAYSNAASATTAAAVSAPTPPSGLTATAISSSQINLIWTDNAGNEDGFRIERCGGVGCTAFAEIGTASANATSYQSTGLAPGANYSYRVRAYNAAGQSAYSNVATATAITEVVGATVYASTDNTLLINSADPSAASTAYAGGALYVGCLFFIGVISNFACYEVALKFDVQPLIQGKTVERAVLRLYPSELAPDPATTYMMCAFAGPWSASTITFNNKPSCFTFGAYDQPPPRSSAPLEYDITPIVRNWANGTWANNGLFLFPTDAVFPSYTTIRVTEFESMNVYSALVRRPQVYIEYR